VNPRQLGGTPGMARVHVGPVGEGHGERGGDGAGRGAGYAIRNGHALRRVAVRHAATYRGARRHCALPSLSLRRPPPTPLPGAR
jgi:hypothetical protein